MQGYLAGVDGSVEVSGASGTRITEAKARLKVAETDLMFERRDAVARAWIAYVNAQFADARLRVLDESIAVQERVAAASVERVAAGVGTEPDVLTVQAELAMMRAERTHAERIALVARGELLHIIDFGPEHTLALDPIPDTLPEVASFETLVARALEERPDLANVRARIELLSATDRRLFREAIPRLGYNLGIDGAPASPAFAFFGLSVENPFAQRNQGERAVTNAQARTERLRLDSVVGRLGREVKIARESYQKRRAELAIIANEAAPSVERTRALIETGWRAGRFDVFRLTSATREALRLRREVLDLTIAAWTDFVALELATGGLKP
jgi:outer membrane protein TolC